MRLIDADALIEDLEFDVELDCRALDDMNLVGSEREHIQRDKDCKQNAIDLLRNTPSINPEVDIDLNTKKTPCKWSSKWSS